MAGPFDGNDPVLIDGDLLVLPSNSDPRVTIYRGTDGTWVLEHADESTTPITHLQTFDIEGRTFRFCCPEAITKTSLAWLTLGLEVRHLHLVLSVSRDEEHVRLQVQSGASTTDLGARTHNYLLLTLARRR